ncbi:uncharacterized protein LOC112687502 [Sipha flava]|uniref:Uncharacterized protein LOC112687502 n=1 Tax=Sipha flava TaxID=143950 RepID=A0A8B8FZQ3_9HEMI|nr:uncharacterized protein LOC112687502 [Sipha flava]
MNSNVSLDENLGKKVVENKIKDDGTFGKACAGLAEKRAIAAVVDASAHTLGDDKRVKKVSTIKMSKKVVVRPASLGQHDTDRPLRTTKFPNGNDNCVSASTESVNSTNNADIANRIRLSNNPGVCKLKKLNS